MRRDHEPPLMCAAAPASWTAAVLCRFRWLRLIGPKRQRTGAVQDLAEFGRFMERKVGRGGCGLKSEIGNRKSEIPAARPGCGLVALFLLAWAAALPAAEPVRAR